MPPPKRPKTGGRWMNDFLSPSQGNSSLEQCHENCTTEENYSAHNKDDTMNFEEQVVLKDETQVKDNVEMKISEPAKNTTDMNDGKENILNVDNVQSGILEDPKVDLNEEEKVHETYLTHTEQSVSELLNSDSKANVNCELKSPKTGGSESGGDDPEDQIIIVDDQREMMTEDHETVHSEKLLCQGEAKNGRRFPESAFKELRQALASPQKNQVSSQPKQGDGEHKFREQGIHNIPEAFMVKNKEYARQFWMQSSCPATLQTNHNMGHLQNQRETNINVSEVQLHRHNQGVHEDRSSDASHDNFGRTDQDSDGEDEPPGLIAINPDGGHESKSPCPREDIRNHPNSGILHDLMVSNRESHPYQNDWNRRIIDSSQLHVNGEQDPRREETRCNDISNNRTAENVSQVLPRQGDRFVTEPRQRCMSPHGDSVSRPANNCRNDQHPVTIGSQLNKMILQEMENCKPNDDRNNGYFPPKKSYRQFESHGVSQPNSGTIHDQENRHDSHSWQNVTTAPKACVIAPMARKPNSGNNWVPTGAHDGQSDLKEQKYDRSPVRQPDALHAYRSHDTRDGPFHGHYPNFVSGTLQPNSHNSHSAESKYGPHYQLPEQSSPISLVKHSSSAPGSDRQSKLSPEQGRMADIHVMERDNKHGREGSNENYQMSQHSVCHVKGNCRPEPSQNPGEYTHSMKQESRTFHPKHANIPITSPSGHSEFQDKRLSSAYDSNNYCSHSEKMKFLLHQNASSQETMNGSSVLNVSQLHEGSVTKNRHPMVRHPIGTPSSLRDIPAERLTIAHYVDSILTSVYKAEQEEDRDRSLIKEREKSLMQEKNSHSILKVNLVSDAKHHPSKAQTENGTDYAFKHGGNVNKVLPSSEMKVSFLPSGESQSHQKHVLPPIDRQTQQTDGTKAVYVLTSGEYRLDKETDHCRIAPPCEAQCSPNLEQPCTSYPPSTRPSVSYPQGGTHFTNTERDVHTGLPLASPVRTTHPRAPLDHQPPHLRSPPPGHPAGHPPGHPPSLRMPQPCPLGSPRMTPQNVSPTSPNHTEQFRITSQNVSPTRASPNHTDQFRMPASGPACSPRTSPPGPLGSPTSSNGSRSPFREGEHMRSRTASVCSGDVTFLGEQEIQTVGSPNNGDNDGRVNARLCQICNDAASGFHYGVWSCEGCKAFFKRSLQGPTDYICPATNNCTIDKHRRKSCQACRLRKCTEMGMSRGNCREKKTYRQYSRSLKRKSESPSDCEIVYSKQSRAARGMSEDPNQKMFPQQIKIKKEPQVCPVQPLMDPYQVNQTSPMGMAPNEVPPIHPLVEHLMRIDPPVRFANPGMCTAHQTVLETILKLTDIELMDIVSWAKGVPGYMELALSDRMGLLETSWMEILLLGLVWRSIPHSELLAFAPDLHVKQGDLQKEDLAPVCQKLLVLVSAARGLRLEREELVLLRASVLLNAGVHDLNTEVKFMELQNKINEALHYTVVARHRHSVSRITRLLLLLPQLRQVSIEFIAYLSTLKDCFKLPSTCNLIGEILSNQSSLKAQLW